MKTPSWRPAPLDKPSNHETTWQSPYDSLVTDHYSLFRSRHWQAGKDSFDDGFARDRFGLGFVADNDAVAQHVLADAFDILRRDVAAAIQKGVGTCAEGEVDCCAWRSAVTHEPLESQII